MPSPFGIELRRERCPLKIDRGPSSDSRPAWISFLRCSSPTNPMFDWPTTYTSTGTRSSRSWSIPKSRPPTILPNRRDVPVSWRGRSAGATSPGLAPTLTRFFSQSFARHTSGRSRGWPSSSKHFVTQQLRVATFPPSSMTHGSRGSKHLNVPIPTTELPVPGVTHTR